MTTPPLGYRIGPDRHFEIDPISAKAVQEIFTRYAAGERPTNIINYLNEHGFKTSRGNAFNKNSLPRILHNDCYIGTYHYDDVTIENGMPAIIDKNLFIQVQQRLARTTKAPARNKATEEYLLSSKVFCGHCGEPLIGESGTGKSGKIHRYYKCAGRKRKHNCDKAIEKKDWLETTVIQYTTDHVLTDENIDLIADKVIQIANEEFADKSTLIALQQKLKDIDKRIANLISAMEQGIITATTKNRLMDLETERTGTEKQIAKEELKKPFLTKDHIIYYLNLCKQGDTKTKNFNQQLIDTLINAVYVYDTPDPNKRNLKIIYNISNNNTYTFSRSDLNDSVPSYLVTKSKRR